MPARPEKPNRSERRADGAFASGAIEHPIRWYLATLLSDRLMTATELGRVVEMPPSVVRRHLRAMEEAEVIEVVEVRARRGAGEKVYALRRDFILSDEELAAISPDVRRRIDGYTLKVGLGEALRSLVSSQTAITQGRTDSCLTRIPMVLDEEGWTELARIHHDAYLKVMELRDRVEGRLLSQGEDGIRATSLILCFEVAPPSL